MRPPGLAVWRLERLLASPFSAPDGLIHVGQSNDDLSVGNVGFQTLLDWRERVQSFAVVVPIRAWSPTIIGESGPERLDAWLISCPCGGPFAWIPV